MHKDRDNYVLKQGETYFILYVSQFSDERDFNTIDPVIPLFVDLKKVCMWKMKLVKTLKYQVFMFKFWIVHV